MMKIEKLDLKEETKPNYAYYDDDRVNLINREDLKKLIIKIAFKVNELINVFEELEMAYLEPALEDNFVNKLVERIDLKFANEDEFINKLIDLVDRDDLSGSRSDK